MGTETDLPELEDPIDPERARRYGAAPWTWADEPWRSMGIEPEEIGPTAPVKAPAPAAPPAPVAPPPAPGAPEVGAGDVLHLRSLTGDFMRRPDGSFYFKPRDRYARSGELREGSGGATGSFLMRGAGVPEGAPIARVPAAPAPGRGPAPGAPVSLSARLESIERQKADVNDRYGQFSKWIDEQMPDAAAAASAKGRLASGWQARLKDLDKEAEAIRKGQELQEKDVQKRAKTVADLGLKMPPPGELVKRTAPEDDGTVYGQVRKQVLAEQDRLMAEFKKDRTLAKKQAIYELTQAGELTPGRRARAQQKFRQAINKINAQERDALARLHGAYADDLRQAAQADEQRKAGAARDEAIAARQRATQQAIDERATQAQQARVELEQLKDTMRQGAEKRAELRKAADAERGYKYKQELMKLDATLKGAEREKAREAVDARYAASHAQELVEENRLATRDAEMQNSRIERNRQAQIKFRAAAAYRDAYAEAYKQTADVEKAQAAAMEKSGEVMNSAEVRAAVEAEHPFVQVPAVLTAAEAEQMARARLIQMKEALPSKKPVLTKRQLEWLKQEGLTEEDLRPYVDTAATDETDKGHRIRAILHDYGIL